MPDYSFKVKLSDVSASQLSSNVPRSPDALPFYRLDFNGKIVQSDVAMQPGDPSWQHKCSFEYRLQEESFEACLQSLAGRWASISVLFLEPNTGHETLLGSCSVDLLTLATGASRCLFDLKNNGNGQLNLPYQAEQSAMNTTAQGTGAVCGKVEFTLVMEQQMAIVIELQNINISPMPAVAPYKLAYTLQSMNGAHELESNVVSASSDPTWDAQLLPKLVTRSTLRDFLADSLFVVIKDVSHKGSPAVGRFELLMSDIIQTHVAHTAQFRRNAYAVTDTTSLQNRQQASSANGLVHSFNNNSRATTAAGNKPSAVVSSSWGALVTGSVVFRDLPQLAQMNPESASNVNGKVHGKPLLPSCMVPATHSKYPSTLANLSRATNRTFVQNGGIPVAATQFHNDLYGPPNANNLTSPNGSFTSQAPPSGQVGYFPTSPKKVAEYGGAAGGTNTPYTTDGTAPMTADTVRAQLQHMEDRKAKFNIAPPALKPSNVAVHHYHHYGGGGGADSNASQYQRPQPQAYPAQQPTPADQPQFQAAPRYTEGRSLASPHRVPTSPPRQQAPGDQSSYGNVDPLFRVHSRRGSMVGAAPPPNLNASTVASFAAPPPPSQPQIQSRFDSPSRNKSAVTQVTQPAHQAAARFQSPPELRAVSPPRKDNQGQGSAAATITAAARASLHGNPITVTGQAIVDQYREAVTTIEAQMSRIAMTEQKINDDTTREESLLQSALRQLQREEDTMQLDLEKCGRTIKEMQRAEEDFVGIEHRDRLEVEMRENGILNELNDLGRVERELQELIERIQLNIREDEKGRERARAERDNARLRLDVTSRDFVDLSHKVNLTAAVRSPLRVVSPPRHSSLMAMVPKHVSPPRDHHYPSPHGTSMNGSRALGASSQMPPPATSLSHSLALKHQDPVMSSPHRSPTRTQSRLGGASSSTSIVDQFSVRHHNPPQHSVSNISERRVLSPTRKGGRGSIAADITAARSAGAHHFDASANYDNSSAISSHSVQQIDRSYNGLDGGSNYSMYNTAPSDRPNQSRALSPDRDRTPLPGAPLEPLVVPTRRSNGNSSSANTNMANSVLSSRPQVSSITRAASSGATAPSMDVTLTLDLKDLTKAIETSNVALFRSIIAQNPDVLYASNSLLHAACATNQPSYEIVAAIVAIRPELVGSIDTVTGNVPLHFLCAAKEPSVKVADCLLSASGGSGSNGYSGMAATINSDGLTPFHIALLNPSDYGGATNKAADAKDGLKTFLLRRCGKEVMMAKTGKGESAAHLCAINDKYLQSLKFLFTNGAQCDQTAIVLGASNVGLAVTPLEKARMYGSASTEVQRYLQHVVGY